ncbi:signal peptide peptidase SppA [Vibrio breoganii]|uniref:signal peptide peptidase SppA n=1 Tax=Vibrio breoganii TaxID=553239 RepID=UPI000C8347D8|nr:signal peptide peptidase SppA [Vibrio breoganii]PMI19542.1 signal peptide peptidase SppA [Vibrio breoganii]PML54434.1 signal peptide peptidase SppA [Vibrio breoganii]PMM88694.1 signal peptide peptidase SppA [Vibrio breoganii]PMO61148.1 signal peptide peptidase SppA [Vibrio breoganii]PMO82495.1 signal peptide peptidase SppA [Vibrio breoganii]
MKTLFRFIGKIIKGIWKVITFIRLALANLLFIAAIVFLYFSFSQINSKDEVAPVEKEPKALVLNISGKIVEQRRFVNPMDSLTGSLLGNEVPRENVLYDIRETIRHAASDENVSGLVLSLKKMPETNLTKLRYIAKALNEFKASGKPVYAIGDFYNQSQYYLASYADKVYLAPDGGVLLRGYSSYSLYYKTLLENLDVTTHVFKVGTYKSAVEPFTRNNMSAPAKEAAGVWLGQLWGAYVDDVASNRGIEKSVLNPSMDAFLKEFEQADGSLAQLAMQLGMVDELATRQQAREAMIEAFGGDDKNGFKSVGYYTYKDEIIQEPEVTDNEIAVVVASGAIMDGLQQGNSVGGDTTAGLIRKARLNEDIKALVLRVDSPGGSAFASEVIRNELIAFKETNRPVVVSMSSLAASGGYWISMSADEIMAQPTTLTGSIGIFSVVTTFEKGFNKYGVYSDGLGTSPFSGIGIATGLNDGAKRAMQLGIENGYRRFTGLVSENRGIEADAVEKIAEGRVWTGQDAVDNGLVDSIGDFDDAIARAASLAEIDTYSLNWLQKSLTPAQQFLQDFSKRISVSLGLDVNMWLPSALQPIASQVQQDLSVIQQFNDPNGYYTLCLPCQVQ